MTTLSDVPLYAPDRVVFMLSRPHGAARTLAEPTSATVQQLASRHRLKRTSRILVGQPHSAGNDIYVGYLLSGADIPQVCEQLEADPAVEWAEPDYYYRCQRVPDDTYYASSGAWGQAYGDLWGLHAVNTQDAWDRTQGEGIVVAVIDTGVDYNHEDLYRDSNVNGRLDPNEQYNIWVNPGEDLNGNGLVDANDFNGKDDDGNGFVDDIRGWNFVGGNNNPIDDHGHGSHCAGIIAAVADNGKGIAGVAPRARVMAVKSLDSQGTGTATQLAAGINYAVNNGAHILSLSWGGGGQSNLIRTAIDRARSLNRVVVVAAGNDSLNAALWSPANIPGVLTVAALEPDLKRASFSNVGSVVDFSAPGVDVLSLRAAGTDMYGDGKRLVPTADPNARYYRADGTSMACPFVSGIAALLMELHPSLSETAVRRILAASASPADSAGAYIGEGIINAQASLDVVQYTSDVNAAITQPADDTEPFATDRTLDFVGIAQGDAYVLEVGHGYYPDTWVSIGQGDAIADGVLGSLDLSGRQGPYHVRLTVAAGERTAVEHTVLWAEPDLHSGWPVRLGGNAFRFGGFILGASFNATPADADGDGADEIFLGSIGHTFGLRGDGTILPGWPTVQLDKPAFASNGPYPGPAVADIDNDGRTEILWTLRDYWPDYFGSPSTVWCFNGRNLDGSRLTGFPQQAIETPSNAHELPFILADLDGDGTLEAVAAHTKGNTSNYYRLSAFDHTGRRLFTRDLPDSTENMYALSFGDIDGDGRKELVAISQLGYTSVRLHVFDAQGIEKTGYPMTLRGLYNEAISAPPFLADLDRDGDLEVLVGTTGTQSYIHAYHHNGAAFTGFPIRIGNRDTQIFAYCLGDITGDGEPELIVGANYRPIVGLYRMHAVRLNGLSLPGWPIDLSQWPKGPAAVVDVDNDGLQDVCFTTFDGSVHAYAADARPIPGFPKKMSFLSTSGVSVADVDGDGRFELIAATMTGTVYVWDLPTPAYYENSDWPMRHVNPRNTNVFGDRRLGRNDCDFSGDNRVNWTDLALFLQFWLEESGSEADFNRDGRVDFADAARCLKYWN